MNITLSDSEDNCYKSKPLKLRKLLNKKPINNCDGDTIDLTAYSPIRTESFIKTDNSVITIPDEYPSGTGDYDSTNLFLNEPIESSKPKKRKLKAKRRNSDSDFLWSPQLLDECGFTNKPGVGKSKIKTRSKTRGRGRGGAGRDSVEDAFNTSSPSPTPPPSRGLGRGRGKRRALSPSPFLPIFPHLPLPSPKGRGGKGKSKALTRTSSRGRGRGKSIISPSIFLPNLNFLAPSPEEPEEITKSKSSTGTSRRGRRSRGSSNVTSQTVLLPPHTRQASGNCRAIPASQIPIFSVGNTDEYPDMLEDQPLFSNKPIKPCINEVCNSLDNEESSVKVYWQSFEVVKFNIRKMQKLTQIFDHFIQRESVGKENLIFTYDNKILKPDDTLESIDYNIVKFIEGGIINNTLSLDVKPDNLDVKPDINRFKVKFQCQGQKRPFETNINEEDKLQLAMVRCAEHYEMPITKLRFEFDGDIIQGQMKPVDIDMASGDCIDVKILK